VGKWLIGLSVREPGVAAPDLDTMCIPRVSSIAPAAGRSAINRANVPSVSAYGSAN